MSSPKGSNFVTTLLLLLFTISCSEEKVVITDLSNGNRLSEWNGVLTEAIITDLFSPPVASRIYAYSNIAAYEVLCKGHPEMRSFAGIIDHLEPVPSPENDIAPDLFISSMTAFLHVGKALVYTSQGLEVYESGILDSLRNTGLDEELIKISVEYGIASGAHILNWASSDMYRETRSATRYSLLEQKGTWLPTPPDYTPAMEPHWGAIRPFVIDSSSQFRPDSLVEFNEDPSSEFYQMVMEVYEAVNAVNEEQIDIARFWDDNPVVTEHTGHLMVKNKKMTPGGHWVYIASLAIRDHSDPMTNAARTYALTSIALADAFIASFESKYYFHAIRPVTYINEYISSDWQPILQTPPFPEYPSAHSTISASAAVVLAEIYGDEFAFTDSSELRFNLPVRSFTSFTGAADEVALSRFYGGIHYTVSNEVGSSMGKKVGAMVAERLISK